MFQFLGCMSLLLYNVERVYISMDIRLQAAKSIAAGLATIGLVGAGAGVGIVSGSLLISVSRNPEIKGELFQYAILGFALTEAVGLLALMMAFSISFM
jgi:F-type H+-transporting ATPase subunit c